MQIELRGGRTRAEGNDGVSPLGRFAPAVGMSADEEGFWGRGKMFLRRYVGAVVVKSRRMAGYSRGGGSTVAWLRLVGLTT